MKYVKASAERKPRKITNTPNTITETTSGSQTK